MVQGLLKQASLTFYAFNAQNKEEHNTECDIPLEDGALDIAFLTAKAIGEQAAKLDMSIAMEETPNS